MYFKWPNNKGPIMAYLANCGSVTCDKYNIASAKWFKIDQKGLRYNAETNVTDWAQNDLCMFSKLFSQHLQVISSSLFFSLR